MQYHRLFLIIQISVSLGFAVVKSSHLVCSLFTSNNLV